jgi:pimeloyl-ACP methyl ester carboxylesterase
VRTAAARPRGIVFAPPLIGGRAAQQVRMLRPLIRRGFDLLTFSFSGHGASAGRFCLASSIIDTEQMLAVAVEDGRRRHIPVYGLASSYSAIPLLCASHRRREPLTGLVLINPLAEIRLAAAVSSFLAFFRRVRATPGARTGIGEAVEVYLETLFPAVWKSRRRFGALERRRTRIFRILAESFRFRPLGGVFLETTPTLCVYGVKDEVIRLFHPDLQTDYEALIRRHCPRVEFIPMPGGHFLRTRESRDQVLCSILAFIRHPFFPPSCPVQPVATGEAVA